MKFNNARRLKACVTKNDIGDESTRGRDDWLGGSGVVLIAVGYSSF